jgi:oxygen-dependent protoporphyrinogen oxidase
LKYFDRIVIGAGISGLLAAWRAIDRDEKTLVIHHGNFPGGIIQRCQIGGLTVDSGAESFSIASSEVSDLISELNLSHEVISPSRFDARIVLSEEQKLKIPHGIFGIPSSLDDSELENIISPRGLELAKYLDRQPIGDVSGFTIGQIVEQRLGVEFLTKLVDPIIAGVHASSASNLDAETTMPVLMRKMYESQSLCKAVENLRGGHLRPGSAVASLDQGLYRLSDGIFTYLKNRGVEFILDQRVGHLIKDDFIFQVRVKHDTMKSKNLTISAGIEGSFEIFKHSFDLKDSMLPAVDVAIALAYVESKQLNLNPLGSGALVGQLNGCTAKATTHINAKWDWVQRSLPKNHHVVRLSYGRDGKIPEGPLRKYLHNDLAKLYDISDHQIIESKEIKWKNSLFRSTFSSRSVLKQITESAEQLGIELCGSYISGNGILGITQDHYKRKAS